MYNNPYEMSMGDKLLDKANAWISPKITKATPEMGALVPVKPLKGARGASGSKTGGLFKNLKSTGSGVLGDLAFTADNFFNPNAGGGISYGLGTKSTGGLGKAGINIGKRNLGRYATGINTAMQVIDAIGGLSEMSSLNQDADTLTGQILASAGGNPLLHSYLTSSDLALLGKLQRGSYDATGDFGDAFDNFGNILSNAGQGALYGAAGGLPGIILGGIGGAINGGIDNVSAATSGNISELEGLYQRLLDAEMQYKSMKRPNFTGLGIQQQYQNMYA